MRGRLRWLWPALLLLAMLAAPPATAQVFTGRIEVTVMDATGGVLPGVVVEVTGPQKATFVTGPDGVARFLNLEPGTYQVKATIQGFQEYQNTNVPVVAGGTVPLRISLKVAGVQEQILVTAESPIIDTKKSGTTTAVTLEQLQDIPSSRDPWVVMQTVPGIVVDRVNVGGAESGQQSGYQAKGASNTDATWTIDGIPVTDMSALGGTPTYYDFDMLQEMSVNTGGSDLGSSTGGVHLNLILKSGTNTWHGSARGYFENESMQWNNMDPAIAEALGSPTGQGNRMNQYADYGFEVGGPILKDRLWAWGSLGKTDVRLLTIKQTPDRTILNNRGLKVQAQANKNIRAGFTYFFGDKNKYGRQASATRTPPTTENQKGPGSLYKGEANFVIGNNLFLTARGSYFPTGFSFTPQGGMDAQVYWDDGGVVHGSYYSYVTDRPQIVGMAEGSYFRGRHEVKFGFSYRRTTVNSNTVWPGNEILTFWNGYPDLIAEVDSQHPSGARAYYRAAWIADSITTDRMTASLGLRFDWQTDGTLPVSVPAVPGFEQWLPALSSPAVPNAVTWNSVSPRISVSYALDEARKTLARGSYAMFASQLLNGVSNQISVVQYRYIAFSAVDLNGNNIADPNEIDTNDIQYIVGFNRNNPGQLTTINQIAGFDGAPGKYHVPKTHEFIVGVDRELIPNFGLSAAFTYRKLVDFNWYPHIGVTRADYEQAGTLTNNTCFDASGDPCPALPNGASYSVPYYTIISPPDPSVADGTIYTARNGYHQRFIGFEVTATKRLSNRWMARFGFSTNYHTEWFDDPNTSIIDPTPSPGDPLINGGLVVTQQTNSGKSGIYQVLPKYQIIANGLYQAPHGIDLGFNFLVGQGFSQPWYRSNVDTPDDYYNSLKSVAVYSNIDQNRLSPRTTLDVRVGKLFKVGRTNFNIDLDIFNLFNSGTVLSRTYDLRKTGGTGFNQVLEIINPRIARIGVRFNF